MRTATITLELKITPFKVPDAVTLEQAPGGREQGFRPPPTVALRELPVETLSAMCDDFRREVFRKAGHPETKEAAK